MRAATNSFSPALFYMIRNAYLLIENLKIYQNKLEAHSLECNKGELNGKS